MFKFASIHEEEISDVKSFIGSFDTIRIVADVKIGVPEGQQRALHEWSYLAVKFTDDAAMVDILKYIVRCQGDDFMGIINGYYVLWFD